MIIDDKYSVSVIPTLCTSRPIMIKEIEREGVDYVQFIFGKDDPILENTKVVKKDVLSYNFLETYYMQGRVPWFIDYEDLVRIMDNMYEYAKSGMGDNFIANELITSFITRSSKDKKIFHRQDLKNDHVYVDLMNVYYSTLGSLTKIAGNYMTEAVTSAIVQQSKHTTKLEQLAR